jgi:hypothetical protein
LPSLAGSAFLVAETPFAISTIFGPPVRSL